MKILVRLSAFFLISLLSACGGKSFEVDFDLASDIESSYRLLYYASGKNGGRWIESAAPVHQGKFTIECQTVYPTVVYVFRSHGNEPETFFYAERGDKIKITGDNAMPLMWTIRGNKVTDRLSEWQSANLNLLEKHSPSETNKAVASFVEKNKGSEIDPLLLLLRYDRGEDPEEFVRLWNMMDEKLRKSDFTELVCAPDILSPSPLTFDSKGNAVLAPGKDKFKTLKIRSLANGSETLRLTAPGRKGSMIYFWHLGDPRRHEILDSLRTLARRQGGDSIRLLIADICLDGDSLRWRNAARFDSLDNVTRAWWPAGEADPQAIRLGVAGYRTVVVVGPDGTVRYKGDNIHEAMKRLPK